MSGIFRAGQLVKVIPELLASDERLQLFNVPGGIERVEQDKGQVRAIGWLTNRDVALVIWHERTVGGDVYLLGPHGGGWAPSAFLRIL